MKVARLVAILFTAIILSAFGVPSTGYAATTSILNSSSYYSGTLAELDVAYDGLTLHGIPGMTVSQTYPDFEIGYNLADASRTIEITGGSAVSFHYSVHDGPATLSLYEQLDGQLFYVEASDGASETVSVSFPNVWPLTWYASCLWPPDGAGTVNISDIQVMDSTFQYVNQGSWEKVIDVGVAAIWKTYSAGASIPSGSQVSYQFCSSADNVTYSPWTSELSAVPSNRYLKTRALLTTSDPSVSPTLSSLSITYTAPPTAPGIPTTTSPTTNRRPTWSWTPSTGVDPIAGYYLTVGTSPGGTDIQPETWVTGLSWQHPSNLSVGTYYVQVQAKNSAGELGPWSPSGTVQIDPPSAPGDPKTTNPTTDRRPTWTWTESTDSYPISGYYLKVGTSAGAEDVQPSTTWVTGRSWQHPSNLNVGTYYAQVQAKDSLGQLGPWSAPGTVRIDPSPPSAPGTPMTTSPTTNPRPTWKWVAATGKFPVTGYNLRIGRSPSASDVLPATFVTGTSWTHPSDLGLGAYYAQVQAVDNLGQVSPWSDVGTVKVNAVTSFDSSSLLTGSLTNVEMGANGLQLQQQTTTLEMPYGPDFTLYNYPEGGPGGLSYTVPCAGLSFAYDVNAAQLIFTIDGYNGFYPEQDPLAGFTGPVSGGSFSTALSPGAHSFSWNAQLPPDNYGYGTGDVTISGLTVTYVKSSYVPRGTWEKVIDTGAVSTWQTYTANATVGPNSRLIYEFASSPDNVNYSAWNSLLTAVPSNRYLKARVTFITGDATESPTLTSFSVSYDSRPSTPGTPTTPTPTANQRPTWTWTPSTGANVVTGYETRVGTSAGAADIVPETWTTSTSFTQPSDLRVGETYFAQVRAKDNTGQWGEWSQAGKVFVMPADTLDTQGPTVGQPRTVETGPIPFRTPTWTWDAAADPSGVAGYYIRLSSANDGRGDLLPTTWVGNVTSWKTPFALPVGTAYAQVQAEDGVRNVGPFSAAGSITIQDDTTLPVVTAPTTFDQSSVSTWTWAPATDPAEIKGYYFNGTWIGNVTEYTYIIDDYTWYMATSNLNEANPSTKFYVEVKAVDYAGNVSIPATGVMEVTYPLNQNQGTVDTAATIRWYSARYNVKGVPAPGNPTGTGETVNSECGELTLQQTDLVLPGRNGLDLAITRVYNTNQASSSFTLDTYGLGRGWSFAFPALEDYHGAKFLHMEDGTVYRVASSFSSTSSNLEGVPLRTITINPDSSYAYEGVTSSYLLQTKDGIKYYFGSVNGVLRLLAKKDRHDNIIRFFYTGQKLSKIRDTANREVLFTYGSDGLLKSIAYAGKVITYEQEEVTGTWAKAIALKSVMITPDQTPVTTTFEYRMDAYESYADLVKVNHPAGGWTAYDYSLGSRWVESVGQYSNYLTYPKVSERKDGWGNLSSPERVFNRMTVEYVGNSDSTSTHHTKFTDAKNTVLDITFDSNRLPVSRVTTNNTPGYFVNETVSTQYELTDRLPIEQTVTRTNQAQASSSATTRWAWDLNHTGDLVTRYGPEGDFEFYAYEQSVHQLQRYEVRQDSDHHLLQIGEFGLDTDPDPKKKNNLLKQRDSRITYTSGSPIETTQHPGSASLDLNKRSWVYIVPRYTSKIILDAYWIASEGFDLGTMSVNQIRFNVAYRKVGASTWITKYSSPTYWGYINNSRTGTDTITIEPSDAPGVYEIKVQIESVTGWSSVTAKNIRSEQASATVDPEIVTDFEYDVYGNVTKKILTTEAGEQPHITSYEYTDAAVTKFSPSEDFEGVHLTKTTIETSDPTQRIVTAAEFDYYGNKVAEIDGKGNRTSYYYDLAGRLSGVEHPAVQGVRASRSILYNDLTNVVTQVDENGHTTVNRLDPVGHLSSSERYLNGTPITVASYTYDDLGNKASETDGNGNTVSYEYDPARRVTKQVFPTTTEFIKIDYDDAARTKTVTNTRNEVTQYTFDALGRMTQVTNKAPDKSQPTVDYSTKYKYDEAGNLVLLTNANNAETKYEYGNYNLLSKVTSPAPLGVVEYTYTNSGKVKTKQVDGALVATYLYDAADRLIGEQFPDGASSTILYDLAGNVRQRYTAKNGVTEIDEAFTYDERNRQTSATTTIDGTPYTLQYSYDPKGNLASITYPGESTPVRYLYDAFDRLWSVPGYAGSDLAAGFTYDNAGNLRSQTYANGITTTITPDNRNRPTLIQSPVLSLSYTYDSENNVTAINGDTFGYDGLNRLTSYTIGGASTTYNYDGAGNRTTQNGSVLWQYNAANELTQIGGSATTHDARGNMTLRPTTDGDLALDYNYGNQLTKLTKGTTVLEQNYYNVVGMRVKRVAGEQTTVYIYSGNDILYEKTGTAATKYIIANGKHLAKVKDGVVTYYHNDHLGSTRALTDSGGAVVATFTYEPFGNTMTQAGTEAADESHKFTGKPEDIGIGLYYYGARFYDPAIGRFITADSWTNLPDDERGYIVGENPGGYNRYVYVLNNPLRFSDPTGHKWDVGGDGRWTADANDPDDIDDNHWSPSPSQYENDNQEEAANPSIELNDDDGATPPIVPPGVNLDDNIMIAQNNKWFYPVFTLGWWLDLIWPGGKNDYKNTVGKQYMDYGNFQFGATGAALGVPNELLLRAGGLVNKDFRGAAGRFPYGDDPRDVIQVMLGIDYYRHH